MDPVTPIVPSAPAEDKPAEGAATGETLHANLVVGDKPVAVEAAAEPESDYTDKVIVCQDCGKPFTWTKGQQAWYAERHYSQPKRCKECAKANRERLDKLRQERNHAGTVVTDDIKN